MFYDQQWIPIIGSAAMRVRPGKPLPVARQFYEEEFSRFNRIIQKSQNFIADMEETILKKRLIVILLCVSCIPLFFASVVSYKMFEVKLMGDYSDNKQEIQYI